MNATALFFKMLPEESARGRSWIAEGGGLDQSLKTLVATSCHMARRSSMPAAFASELCEGAEGAEASELPRGALGGRLGSAGRRMSFISAAGRSEALGRRSSSSGGGTGPKWSSSSLHCLETKVSAADFENPCLHARCCLYAQLLLRYLRQLSTP